MIRTVAVIAFALALPAVAAPAAEVAVPRTAGEAMRWYGRAAEAGSAQAQFLLGLMYERGEGRRKNPGKALDLYLKAANQGYALAQFKVGTFRAMGLAGPADSKEAAAWFRKAAEQGLGIAQYDLGLAYARGDGVGRDPVAAWSWLDRAARAGVAAAGPARDELGRNMTASDLARARADAAKALHD